MQMEAIRYHERLKEGQALFVQRTNVAQQWVQEAEKGKVHLTLKTIPKEYRCHGSKGLWLEVSADVTCSAQVLSVSTRRREDSQDERNKRSWIGDKVETEVSTLCDYGLNTAIP
jgi:hypothetical protein